MIGILDSGTGGLAAARKIVTAYPGAGLTYLGDTEGGPYGNKSRERIRQRVLKPLNALLGENPDLIVVTCHNIAAVCMDLICRYTDIPVIDAVSCSIRRAAEIPGKGGIGVIGDRTAISSGVYEAGVNRISPETRVFGRSCPLLTAIVEEGYSRNPETRLMIKKYLFPLKVRQVKSLVLGSTAYSVLNGEIRRKAGKRAVIVDASIELRDEIQRIFKKSPEIEKKICKNGHKRFFVTDTADSTADAAKRIYGANIGLNRIKL